MKPILASKIEAGFLPWLRAQSPDQPCAYGNASNCPFAIYLHDIGYKKAYVGVAHYSLNGSVIENMVSYFVNGTDAPEFSIDRQLALALRMTASSYTLGEALVAIDRFYAAQLSFSSEMIAA